jgi:hypothetical protein
MSSQLRPIYSSRPGDENQDEGIVFQAEEQGAYDLAGLDATLVCGLFYGLKGMIMDV